MADQQDRCGVGTQEVFQPQHGFQIEVVARFVEQQQVRLGKQQRGESDAHAPAAGKAFQRAVLGFLVKAQAGQDARGAGRGGMGVDRDQPFVHFGQPVAIGAAFAFRHQRGALGIGRQHGFEGRGVPAGGFLRDIAKPAAAGHGDAAAVRLQHAGNDADERGLARAVAADQADPPARRQLCGGIVNDRPPAKANRNSGQVQHPARLAGPARGRKPLGKMPHLAEMGARRSGYPISRRSAFRPASARFRSGCCPNSTSGGGESGPPVHLPGQPGSRPGPRP